MEQKNEVKQMRAADDKIAAAMDRIVQETIGDIPVSEQIDRKKQKFLDSFGGQQEEPAEKKKNWKKRLFLTLLLLVILGAAGVYGYYSYYFSDKFFPGTTINNIPCAELTAGEAESLIKAEVEDYRIDLTFRGDVTNTLEGSSMDYAYVSDGHVAEILKSQNPLLWITGYFENFEYEVAENISFDEEMLKSELMALDVMKSENMEAPADAYMTFQNGHFEIIPEVEGTTIDTDKMLDMVKQAVSESSAEFSAEESGVYVEPAVRSDNEALNADAESLNGVMTASIIYQLPAGEEVLNGNNLREWLTKDENGNYVKDEAMIRQKATDYVNDLADRIDTVGKEHPFTTTSGKEITVSGGSYGWKINRTQEVAQLVSEIMNNAQLAREPIYSSREVTTENNGFGDTYVEIDMTDQKVYYYEAGKIVVETDCVTGKMTRSRYTPEGIFTLTFKQKNRTLRGRALGDGTYEYESFVNFWMPFNGNIGLHDAPWRGSFGGDIYTYSGSHGCVNLPYKKAKEIYERITKEVPIICFYSEDYTVR